MSEANLLHAALKLPARRREKLAEAILGSVKRPSQRHLDSLWVQEAESRVDGLLNQDRAGRPGAARAQQCRPLTRIVTRVASGT